MTSIRKVVVTQVGGDPSTVQVQTGQIAAPSQGEVQVDVICSGFGGSDINMRLGRYPRQPKAPFTTGYSFTGRVAVNGPGASKYPPGTLVCGMSVYNGHAEKINYPEKYIFRVPDGLSPQEAAAVPLDWWTAYGLVYRAAKVTRGQRVFIHGLSGAIGHALTQLCNLNGATVYGTASAKNHALVREYGATPYVYTDKKWIQEMKNLGGVHAVFDPLAFDSWDESWKILCSKEHSVLVGYATNKAAFKEDGKGGGGQIEATAEIARLYAKNINQLFCKKSATFFYVGRDDAEYRPEIEKVLSMASQGQIAIPIKHSWTMDKISEAHDAWGKIGGLGSLMIQVQ